MYEGRLVRLRERRPDEEAPVCAKWLNDPDTARRISAGPMPITPEAERDYILKHTGDSFAVETLDGGRYIGNCSFFDVNPRARSCQVGWLIGDPAMRGKGYGSDMIITLLKFLFRQRNMLRVGLEVFACNAEAVRLYERLGFVREAIYREHVFADGKYWDEYAYGILREEFEERYGDR